MQSNCTYCNAGAPSFEQITNIAGRSRESRSVSEDLIMIMLPIFLVCLARTLISNIDPISHPRTKKKTIWTGNPSTGLGVVSL